jgi:cytochrome c peroxidase
VSGSGSGSIVFVDNQLDNSISRLDLTSGEILTRTRQLPQPLSAAARAGRRAFVDSRNGHLTPFGVVSCATCHPGGGDDGLTWFLHAEGVTPRLRRTQHLGASPVALVGPPAGVTAPLPAGLHWDGEFSSVYDLLHSTVPNLMGGDALLLDPAEFAAFFAEAAQLPVPPTPTDPAQVAAGRAVFEAEGCVDCHKGPALTDQQLHAPLAPMTTTAGDTLQVARTPSLRGVFLRQPLFHDGRAASLQALRSASGLGLHALPPARLDGAAFAALVVYLGSL